NGLALFPAQVVTEVGNISCRHSPHDEALPVGAAEPGGEFPHVLGEGSAAVGREIMGGEEGREVSSFVLADRDGLENIIARILAGLWALFGHHSDTPSAYLG